MPLTSKQIDVIERFKDQLPVKKIAERCSVTAGDVRRYLESKTPGQQKTVSTAWPVSGWLFWPATLLAALTTHVFHPLMSDYSIPQSIFFHFGLLLLWLFAAGSALLNWRTLAFRAPTILLPLGLLLIWATLSLLWAVNPYIGRFELYNWIGAALFFWLMLQMRPSSERLRAALELFFYSSVLTSILGLLQSYGYATKNEFLGKIQQAVGPAATLMHRNEAAHYVSVLIPFGLVAGYYAVREGKYVRLAMCVSGLILSGWFVYQTECAAAVGAGLGGGGVAALFFWGLTQLRARGISARSLWFTGGGTLVAGLLVLTLLALPSWQKTRQMMQGDTNQDVADYFFSDVNLRLASLSGFFEGHTLAHRLSIYANTLAIVADHPLLGVGIGNTFIQYPKYHNRVLEDRFFSQALQMDHVHNDYLQILAELGIVGWLLMTLVLALAVREFWRVLRRTECEQGPALVPVLGLLWCLLGYAMIAFFNFPVERTPPVVVVAFSLGLIFSLNRLETDGGLLRERTLRLPTLLLPVTALLLLVLIFCRFSRARAEFREDMLFRDTQLLQNRNEWGTILRLSNRILEDGSRNRWVMNNYVQALIRAEQPDFAKASRMAEQILQLYPSASFLLGNYGVSLLNQEKWGQALNNFIQMNRLVPEDEFSQQFVINAATQGNLWQEILNFLPSPETIIRQHQQVFRLGRELVNPEFLQKNRPMMIERLREKMQKQKKTNAFRINLYCMACEKLGRSAELQAFLKGIKSVEMDPPIAVPNAADGTPAKMPAGGQ